MFPSASREAPSLVANLNNTWMTWLLVIWLLPIGQSGRLSAPGVVGYVIKYQHHLVDKNDKTPEEKPASQLNYIIINYTNLFLFHLNYSTEIIIQSIRVDVREIILRSDYQQWWTPPRGALTHHGRVLVVVLQLVIDSIEDPFRFENCCVQSKEFILLWF